MTILAQNRPKDTLVFPPYNEVVIQRVAQTIRKYSMLRAGERVGVAVSGGPDSVALLRVLCELQAELGILLAVVHLDHGLRGAESKADAEFVRDLARSLNLELAIETACLAEEISETGENLEQAARRLRYGYFQRLLRENQFQKIAVGHTKSDQAETVLFRLLRGSTTAGLAGIYPVLQGGIVRPLFEVERGEVLDYLRSLGQGWREDSSNRNLSLARNRLRLDLLPRLEKEWNPSIINILAQLADWARDEEAYWQAQIGLLAPQCIRLEGPMAYLDAPQIAALPAASARRLLRHAVERVRGDLRGIEFSHIEQIRSLAALPEGDGRARIPGVDVFRSFSQIRLAPGERVKGLEDRNYSVPLAVPGIYEIPGGQTRLILKLSTDQESNRGYNNTVGCLDWERTPRPLCLRNWRPGDRYHPRGWSGEEKLKTLFQQHRIPVWERRHWPVVASESAIVWVRRFGVAAELAAGPECRIVLEITERESGQEKSTESGGGSV